MKAYASHACIVFQMWMSIFAIATKQSEEQKKKKIIVLVCTGINAVP